MRKNGLTALLVASAAFLPGQVSAQSVNCVEDDTLACAVERPSVDLQRVPNLLQLQARLSRAGDNLDNATLGVVVVRVLRGKETICAEQISAVPLRDSVLNLQIGRNMSCDLDRVIGENAGLALQICLEGQVNCLKPMELGTLPYAVRSRFTSIAERAADAKTATRANYTQRFAADRDTLFRDRIRSGWLELVPSADAQVDALYDGGMPGDFDGGAALGWRSMEGASNTLHLVGKNYQDDTLRLLDRVEFQSDTLDVLGRLRVQSVGPEPGLLITRGGFSVIDDSNIDGTLVVSQLVRVDSGSLTVNGDSTVAGNASIGGASRVGGSLTSAGQMVVERGGAFVNQGNLSVVGDTSVDFSERLASSLLVTSGANVRNGDVVVPGGNTLVSANMNITGDGIAFGEMSAAGLFVQNGDFTVDTLTPGIQLQVDIGLAANGALTAGQNLFVAGAMAFTNDGTMSIGDDAFLFTPFGHAVNSGGDLILHSPLRLSPPGGDVNATAVAATVTAPPPSGIVEGANCGDIPANFIGTNDGCDCPADGDTSCDPDCVNFGNVGGAFCGCQYCQGNSPPVLAETDTNPSDSELVFSPNDEFDVFRAETLVEAAAGVLVNGTTTVAGGVVFANAVEHEASGPVFTGFNISGPETRFENLVMTDHFFVSGGVSAQRNGTFDAFVNAFGLELNGPVVDLSGTICPAGFSVVQDPDDPNFGRCFDVNECLNGQAQCFGPDTYCFNFPGTFECVTCNGGLIAVQDINDANYGRCRPDVDQCALGTDNCFRGPGGECNERPQQWECGCAEGYQGNGIDPGVVGGDGCFDVNECLEGTHTCAFGERCINREGSFDCLPSNARIMFATEQLFPGHVLGFGQGQDACQETAWDLGLEGNFDWWIGGPDTIATFVPEGFDPIYRPDGTLIAHDRGQLLGFTGSLENSIIPEGSRPNYSVWTGMFRDGFILDESSENSNCLGWRESFYEFNFGGGFGGGGTLTFPTYAEYAQGGSTFAGEWLGGFNSRCDTGLAAVYCMEIR